MFALAVLFISLGCVSAESLEDTNSTMVSIDDNSQNDNIKIENTIEEELLGLQDYDDDLGAGDISLSIVNQKNSYSTTDSVTVKMGTYNMASSIDNVNVFLNGKNIATTNYGLITTNGYAVPLTTAQSGNNLIYCSFIASGIWPLTSDTVTFNVNSGGAQPSENASASITIFDMAYPAQSTITSNGDYVADIAYNIVKSGDGFTDESLEVLVNGVSVGSTMPNSSNRLGNLTINEDNEWVVTIVYTASYNGNAVTAISNNLTFITRNTSGEGNSSGNSSTSDEPSASISIYDMAYPAQSTITSNEDYVADIAYNIVKSGDGFTDESLEVLVNGVSVGSTMPNSSNRLGNLTINEDNEWVVTIVYTASYNGKTVTAVSNNLTFITRNTSGGGNASGNSSDNETGDNPQPSGMQVIIRDSANPNSNVININEKTNIVLEYYVTVPEGDVISSDLIIYCNGEAITTITPADKTYSNIGGSIFLNETGDYVFTAIYKYVVFMGDYGEFSSNSVTYHVTISNETPEITPELSIIIQDVFYPNPLTAIVKSNVDGLYTIRIGENAYDVSVNGGSGSTTFTLSVDTYTAEIVSNTNSSLKNSTTFTVYPKGKTTPVVTTDVLIDNGKATIRFNFPADINDEKLTVTLNGKTTKETTINNGEAVVEFDGLDDGDYSYQFFYAGNDDYQVVNNVRTFTIESSTISNDTGNETDTNSSSAGNESQSDTNSSGGNSNQSGSVIQSIVAEDLNRGQGSSYDFKAVFYDKNGNLLTNGEVNFIVNGNDNIVKTDEYGVAKFSNKLDAGTYEIKIRNFATGEVISKTLNIVERITGNKDIKVDYSYSATYRIRLYADNGNVVGAGEQAVITLNNVRYNVITDKNGYATFKVNGLLPKTYTITAEYKGVNVSNKVVVKKLLLKAKNTKFKKAKKVKKYKVTLKTSAGKAMKGKKISLKINGKTYTGKTNAKGVVTFKIKNLKKVGKYKATITYLKTSIKKTITVKR